MTESGGVSIASDEGVRVAASCDRWPRRAKATQAGISATTFQGVARPRSVEEVSQIMQAASRRGQAVVPVGLRSGVCGALEPWNDRELAIDLTGLVEVFELDELSMTVRVSAGMRGSDLEDRLQQSGFTIGHYPQSLYLSTIGGWIATRASGFASTRYGSIEHHLIAITVVLSDGTVVRTPSWPRASVGPDLAQLFVGSEGSLGVLCEATLSIQRAPATRAFDAWVFPAFSDGLQAVRRAIQAGVTPAIVRLYNAAEAERFYTSDRQSLLLTVHEGLDELVECEQRLTSEYLTESGGTNVGSQPARSWWENRFDASALFNYSSREGSIADAIEVAADWRIGELVASLEAALTPLCTELYVHASHFYTTGASAYIIVFLDAESAEAVLAKYDHVWTLAMDTALAFGAAISHHHGIGRLRLPWLEPALGSASEVLRRVLLGLDPDRTLCPGRLAVTSASGTSSVPDGGDR